MNLSLAPLAFAALLFVAGFPQPGSAAAVASSSPTKGQHRLEQQVNAETARLAALKAKLDPALSINRTLRKSSRGNDVKLLQQFLKMYGVYPEGLVTGYFGERTKAAVRRFQEKEGIEAVSIVGPLTRARIFRISRTELGADRATTPPVGIAEAVMTAAIHENGAAALATTSFASTTEHIYAVVRLTHARQDSEIAYIRSYHGAYVSSAVSHPTRDGVAFFHFEWSLKPGKTRTAGEYTIVWYLNGQESTTTRYVVY